MKASEGLTRDIRQQAVTYSEVISGYSVSLVHYANLKCGHVTIGSKINQPKIGQMAYCSDCTDMKLRASGDII